MRIFILGAGGQIGAHVYQTAQARGAIVLGTWYTRPIAGGVPLDIRDGATLADLAADFQPDVIVHAAGMSQVDFAQTRPEDCREIATVGMANIIRAAKRVDARVVALSSDQVFGESKRAMTIHDPAASLSVHGQAMADAEAMLQSKMPGRHLIIRTACVYGLHDLPRNPILHAIHRVRRGHVVTAARDRSTQPTYAPDLAAAMHTLMVRGETGMVHLVGPDRMTEAAMLRQAMFVYGLESDMITGIPAAALCEDAPRPLSPWLDRSSGRALLGGQAIRSLADGLRAMRGTKAPAQRVAA
jgi:dTDP-4-dehydrorhamnose reductase